MTDYPLLIGGRLHPGATVLDVVNPATGQPFASCAAASASQLEAAVAAARQAFPGWAATSWDDRQAVLEAMAAAIEAEAHPLARLLTQEEGKPLAEAEMEVAGSVAMLRHFAGCRLERRLIEDSGRRHVEAHRRPLGVVGAIVPWNFPLLLLVGKIGPALITGNTIVAKPAPTTPLTALRLGVLLAEVVPAGVLNIVAGGNELGARLARHPDVRKLSFTGSTATGAKVMEGAAATLKRLTLELGGNDAAIVLGDVDPKATAAALFQTAFANNGQICVAVKRVYAHRDIHDALCDALAALARAAVVGDGLEQGVTHGPMQNAAQLARVEELVAEARPRGRLLAGGARLDRPGFFFPPTIIADLEDGCRLVDEEQFGPVLPVVRVADGEEAVRRANASPFGLGASVWSADADKARAIALRLDAGTVWINQHLDSMPYIPFGGAKSSGMGVEFGEEGLAEYTQLHILNQAA